MTPAEVRQIVERVVAEHGQGWVVRDSWTGSFIAGPADDAPYAIVNWSGGVKPFIGVSAGDDECARAVALWPEMQRLTAMLREALAGPKEAP